MTTLGIASLGAAAHLTGKTTRAARACTFLCDVIRDEVTSYRYGREH